MRSSGGGGGRSSMEEEGEESSLPDKRIESILLETDRSADSLFSFFGGGGGGESGNLVSLRARSVGGGGVGAMFSKENERVTPGIGGGKGAACMISPLSFCFVLYCSFFSKTAERAKRHISLIRKAFA